MLSRYPRPLQVIGSLAVLSFLAILGINFYGWTLPHDDPALKLWSPLFYTMVVLTASAIILGAIANHWACEFGKHYRETEVFSGSYEVMFTRAVRTDAGKDVIELVCESTEEGGHLRVFRVPLTDTTRDYEAGDVVDLVWTGKDTHFPLDVSYQHAYPA